MDHKII